MPRGALCCHVGRLQPVRSPDCLPPRERVLGSGKPQRRHERHSLSTLMYCYSLLESLHVARASPSRHRATTSILPGLHLCQCANVCNECVLGAAQPIYVCKLGRYISISRALRQEALGFHSWKTCFVAVDGDPVPVPHWGLALRVDQFHDLAARVKASGISFEIEPHLRFKGARARARKIPNITACSDTGGKEGGCPAQPLELGR